jgi:hypothetical protein
MIDAILRAADVMMTNEIGPQLGETDHTLLRMMVFRWPCPDLIQAYLDKFLDLFMRWAPEVEMRARQCR